VDNFFYDIADPDDVDAFMSDSEICYIRDTRRRIGRDAAYAELIRLRASRRQTRTMELAEMTRRQIEHEKELERYHPDQLPPK
jgi:hypothetical protein